MVSLLLCCVVLLGLSILTASPKEVQRSQEDFVPQKYHSDLAH